MGLFYEKRLVNQCWGWGVCKLLHRHKTMGCNQSLTPIFNGGLAKHFLLNCKLLQMSWQNMLLVQGSWLIGDSGYGMASIVLVIRENNILVQGNNGMFCEHTKWVERVPSWDDFITNFFTLIGAGTKYPFAGGILKLHFPEWRWLHYGSTFTEGWFKYPIDNSSLVQVIARRRNGGKPSTN